MSKGMKNFLRAIYILFTFGLGLVSAFLLPGSMSSTITVDDMNSSIRKGDYAHAMSLIGGFYDERIVYKSENADSVGIVIFRAATLDISTKKNQIYELVYTYSGFLYNASSYPVKITGDTNQTKLLVNDSITVDLLDYDSDSDDKYDSIASLESRSFVYFEVSDKVADSVESLKFIDRSGDTFFEATNIVSQDSTYDLGQKLTFDKEFYNNLLEFKTVHNNNSGDEKLDGLKDTFLATSQYFHMSDNSKNESKSNKITALIIVCYFLLIYILFDLLLGARYIYRFFRWLWYKIRHKDMSTIESAVKSDYFSQVTFKLNVPENYNNTISMNYHNETTNIELIFSKKNSYELTNKIRAGEYVNARLECPRLKALNLPDKLGVRGYKMIVTIDFIEEEKNNTEEFSSNMEETNGNQN